MSSPIGGYIGARPAWSFQAQSGVFDINDRIGQEVTVVKEVVAAPGATVLDGIELADPCLVRSVRLSRDAWIRFYDSEANRFADAARLVTVDPAAAVGVQLEIRTSGDQVIYTAPAPCFTNRQPGGGPYPIRLTNESLLADVTVTITYIPLLAY